MGVAGPGVGGVDEAEKILLHDDVQEGAAFPGERDAVPERGRRTAGDEHGDGAEPAQEGQITPDADQRRHGECR